MLYTDFIYPTLTQIAMPSKKLKMEKTGSYINHLIILFFFGNFASGSTVQQLTNTHLPKCAQKHSLYSKIILLHLIHNKKPTFPHQSSTLSKHPLYVQRLSLSSKIIRLHLIQQQKNPAFPPSIIQTIFALKRKNLNYASQQIQPFQTFLLTTTVEAPKMKKNPQITTSQTIQRKKNNKTALFLNEKERTDQPTDQIPNNTIRCGAGRDCTAERSSPTGIRRRRHRRKWGSGGVGESGE